ncbi:MAG: alpha/beta fold hydrolase [Bacteroidota bacterium]
MPLSYTTTGKGAPVILIHGFCESKAIWESFVPTLAEKHQVIALDLGGFGESANLLPTPVTIEALASQVYDLLQSLAIQQATFVAHSLGGYVSLALAEKHPSLFAGLCLFHSTALADTEEKKATRNKVIAFVQKVGVAKYMQSFVASLFYTKQATKHQAAIAYIEAIGTLPR